MSQTDTRDPNGTQIPEATPSCCASAAELSAKLATCREDRNMVIDHNRALEIELKTLKADDAKRGRLLDAVREVLDARNVHIVDGARAIVEELKKTKEELSNARRTIKRVADAVGVPMDTPDMNLIGKVRGLVTFKARTDFENTHSARRTLAEVRRRIGLPDGECVYAAIDSLLDLKKNDDETDGDRVVTIVRNMLGLVKSESLVRKIEDLIDLKKRADALKPHGAIGILNRLREVLQTPHGFDVIDHAEALIARRDNALDVLRKVRAALETPDGASLVLYARAFMQTAKDAEILMNKASKEIEKSNQFRRESFRVYHEVRAILGAPAASDLLPWARHMANVYEWRGRVLSEIVEAAKLPPPRTIVEFVEELRRAYDHVNAPSLDEIAERLRKSDAAKNAR